MAPRHLPRNSPCCVETRFIEGRAASRSASTGEIAAQKNETPMRHPRLRRPNPNAVSQEEALPQGAVKELHPYEREHKKYRDDHQYQHNAERDYALLAASLRMSQGMLCNVTEPETSGYEVGGSKSLCGLHPMNFWAFDLSGIVAFAGT